MAWMAMTGALRVMSTMDSGVAAAWQTLWVNDDCHGSQRMPFGGAGDVCEQMTLCAAGPECLCDIAVLAAICADACGSVDC
jgi:hypothetical protein